MIKKVSKTDFEKSSLSPSLLLLPCYLEQRPCQIPQSSLIGSIKGIPGKKTQDPTETVTIVLRSG